MLIAMYWGYSLESPDPLHQALAMIFGLQVGSVGAALAVFLWAVYVVIFQARGEKAREKTPMAALAAAFRGRVDLVPNLDLKECMERLVEFFGGTSDLGQWIESGENGEQRRTDCRRGERNVTHRE